MIISYCFRYLDDVSLLNAANSSRRLMGICLGDPVLRRRLQEHRRRDIEARRQFYLNPSASMTVSRQAKAGPFGRNVIKQVKTNVQFSAGAAEGLWTKKPTTTRNSGGKIKTTRGKSCLPRSVRL